MSKPQFNLNLPPKKVEKVKHSHSADKADTKASRTSLTKQVSVPKKSSTQLTKDSTRKGSKGGVPQKKTSFRTDKIKSTLEGPQNVMFDRDEIIHLPTDEQIEEAKRVKADEGIQKHINVRLEYNSSILAQPWMLIMECIEDGICDGHARDKDADYWFNHFNNLGALPFRVLAKDKDRFFLALYAASYIHHNNLFNTEADERNPGPSLANPEWDPSEENVEQDGRHWGMKMDAADLPKTALTPEQRKALDRSKELLKKPVVPEEPKTEPVREQVEAQQKSDLRKYVESQQTMKQLEKIRDASPDPYTQKWAIAERLARKPREDWENAPFELKEMVKFCYGWIRDTGEVPYYPENIIEIWWKRPTQSVLNLTPEAIVRRDAIVEKIRQFWVKSVEASPKDKIDLRSQSYRVTLAAMQLEKLIEEHANGADNATEIKKAAMRYFHAHFPIEMLGVKPGPSGTIDPDFEGYVKMCQKYKITFGTLLHEVEL